MSDDNGCLFDEPWIGKCGKPSIGNGDDMSDAAIYQGMCCEKHSKEKCVVCGSQAFTRCVASRGLMCGRPLCDLCGKGEMCDWHASRGPIAVIVELRKQLKALQPSESAS